MREMKKNIKKAQMTLMNINVNMLIKSIFQFTYLISSICKSFHNEHILYKKLPVSKAIT